jgi:hypothetical protein
MSIEHTLIFEYTIVQEVRQMESSYLQSSIKELVDKCDDLELLYLIRGLLGGN